MISAWLRAFEMTFRQNFTVDAICGLFAFSSSTSSWAWDLAKICDIQTWRSRSHVYQLTVADLAVLPVAGREMGLRLLAIPVSATTWELEDRTRVQP